MRDAAKQVVIVNVLSAVILAVYAVQHSIHAHIDENVAEFARGCLAAAAAFSLVRTVIPIIDCTPFRLEPLSLDILTLRKRWEPTNDFTESLYEDLVALHNTTLCDDVEWHLLSHDRVVEMNASMAMGYGDVYGKLFMPPSVCQLFGSALVRRDAIGLSDITELVHPEKRWLMATVRAAKLFVQGLGYASQLFAYGCQLYSIVTQQTISSNRVCTWSTFAGLLASYFGTSVNHKTVGSALKYLQRGNVIADVRNSVSGSRNPPGDFLMGTAKRDGALLNLTAEMPALFRFDGQAATVADLVMANETHPVQHRIGNQDLYIPVNMHLEPHGERTILHSHFNFSHADHQLYKRQSFSCSAGQQWEDEGDGSSLTECPDGHGQSQGADGFYLGMDWYALNEYDALDWDAGTSGPDGNGFEEFTEGPARFMADSNCWDMCVCFAENDEWTATGAAQWTWDGGYNGYSACWNAGCDDSSSPPV